MPNPDQSFRNFNVQAIQVSGHRIVLFPAVLSVAPIEFPPPTRLLIHTQTMTETLEIIQPSGILDSAKTQDLRDQINQSIEQGAKTILVDLQFVTFMDSSGLGALVTSFKTVQASGGKLCVCAINDQVKILFELTSMDRVLEIFQDQDHFLRQRELSLSVPS